MSRGRIGIVLQARVGSKRLPGKVLRPLAGKPMIQWIIERLKTCKNSGILILATTTSKQDDTLADLAKKLGVEVFRGSESDVLDRYYQCTLAYGLDDIVRSTGDNPFVDPEECDRLVDFYVRNQLDYAITSTDKKGGYPLGVGVEVFSFLALKKAWKEGIASHHREHVNEYFLENADLFKQGKMCAPTSKCAPELSLTVDTIDQFEVAERIYKNYLCQHPSSLVPTTWAISVLRKIKTGIPNAYLNNA